jgi:hypothetical protein
MYRERRFRPAGPGFAAAPLLHDAALEADVTAGVRNHGPFQGFALYRGAPPSAGAPGGLKGVE